MQTVKSIGINAPLRWLWSAWRDFMQAPAPCLIYGLVIALLSFGIWRALIASNLAFWALSLSCGFVFIAPMLAMGMYEAGRLIGAGQRPGILQIFVVRNALRSDVFYLGLTLLLIYLLWGRVAQIVYGLSTYHLYQTVPEFINFALSTSEGHGMVLAGTIIGGVMAFFTFSITVVSAPMLLDQNANVFGAIFVSLQAVERNFMPLVFWAMLITLLLLASAATSWVALAIVFPWLGLASWRAYGDLVVDSTLQVSKAEAKS